MKVRVVVMIVLLQILSRFAAAPVTGFVSDDWSHYWRSVSPAGYSAIAQRAVQEPSRPVQALVLHCIYRLFDTHYLFYGLLSMAVYSLWLIIAMWCVYRLMKQPGAAYLFGIIFAVLPNLTESFQWAALITVSYLQLAYIISLWLWLEFLHGGRYGVLITSALLYAVGVGSYESGILLPVAFAVLGWDSRYFRKGAVLLPYGLVLMLYLLWRYTECFGMGEGVLYVPRSADISLFTMLGNAVSVIDWWLGPRMLTCITNGFRVFLTMRLRGQLLLGLLNFVGVLAVMWVLRSKCVSSRPRRRECFALWHVPVFGLIWCVVSYAPCLVSWTAGRLNFLPAFGITVVLVWVLSCINMHKHFSVIALLVFAGLIVGQGTAYAWREAALFHQRLYECLKSTHMEWRDKEVLLLDTHSYRQRVTPGLSPAPSGSPFVYTVYGNAAMIRGYVPRAMMQIIQHNSHLGPRAVMDVECGAVWKDGNLLWHERFNPDFPHRTAQARVFVVDMLKAESITSCTGENRSSPCAF